MRAVVERVSRAKVTVNGWISGEIGMGLLVLLGVGQETPTPMQTIWQKKSLASASSKIMMAR